VLRTAALELESRPTKIIPERAIAAVFSAKGFVSCKKIADIRRTPGGFPVLRISPSLRYLTIGCSVGGDGRVYGNDDIDLRSHSCFRHDL
jgi:hypothetical protein